MLLVVVPLAQLALGNLTFLRGVHVELMAGFSLRRAAFFGALDGEVSLPSRARAQLDRTVVWT